MKMKSKSSLTVRTSETALKAMMYDVCSVVKSWRFTYLFQMHACKQNICYTRKKQLFSGHTDSSMFVVDVIWYTGEDKVNRLSTLVWSEQKDMVLLGLWEMIQSFSNIILRNVVTVKVPISATWILVHKKLQKLWKYKYCK